MQKLWRASWIWDLVLLRLVSLVQWVATCSILPGVEIAIIPPPLHHVTMKLHNEGSTRVEYLCAGSVTPLPQPGNDKPRSFRLESVR